MKIIILTLFLAACSSKSYLTIKTKPESATISAFNEKTQAFEPIGQTPVIIKDQDLAYLESGVLKIEKKGFVTENIIFPAGSISSTEITFQLKENHEWIGKESKSISKVAEDIAKTLHQINRHTSAREYNSALTLSNTLIDKYPDTSLFYDIRGSIYLLLNQREEARRNFQKSLELSPGNLKTKALLEKI